MSLRSRKEIRKQETLSSSPERDPLDGIHPLRKSRDLPGRFLGKPAGSGTWGNRELFGEAYACMPGEVLMVNVVAAEKSRILFLDLGRILNVCTPACSHHNRLIHNLLYIMAKKNLMLTRKIDHMGQQVHPGKGDGVPVL